LKLFIANKNYSSWSLRPWALMVELGIPFDEEFAPFAPSASNWEAFRRFSPSGKVPCLVDGTTTVWDSLAITEYLAEQYPAVWPAERAARAWARSAAAEMHSGFGALRNECSMSCGVRVSLKSVSAALQQDLDRLSELWAQGLTRFGGPYLAGRAFTAVDAFFAPVAFRVQTYGLRLEHQAHTYVNTLLACKSSQRWYEQALAETLREPGHDKDITAAGTLTADYRSI
jgi:glutathione S-transferase